MPCTPHGLDPAEWMNTGWCSFCKEDTQHFYREFKDEPLVERECLSCTAVATYWDDK